MPGVPQVAVFDTAFHQTMEPKAFLYAIPYEQYQKHKIRKYGFHGTSHKYVANRAAVSCSASRSPSWKLVTFHLGNGSSVTAIDGGKSVDTSMGFYAALRRYHGDAPGVIDPAIITYIMDKENLTIKEVDDMLNKQSGVLGISGISSDFRDLDAAAQKGDARAKLALICLSIL